MEDHRGMGASGGGDGEGMIERRSSARKRHIAPRLPVVNDALRKQAATSRLAALENDNGAFDVIEDENDDAYMGEDTEEVFKQKRAKPKRRTRQAWALEKAGAKKKEAKTFADYLEEANLESLPPDVPSYLTAAVGPPSTYSRRHFCSVCGYLASYTCTRCGARFCCSRCLTIHTDTRCLKFLA